MHRILENIGGDFNHISLECGNPSKMVSNNFATSILYEIGNPITLIDPYKLNEINAYGNRYQEGTPTPTTPIDIECVEGMNIKIEGKNLFDVENSSFNIRGFNITKLDNLINIDGTCTERGAFNFFDTTNNTANYVSYIPNAKTIKLKQGTYTVSLKNVSGNQSSEEVKFVVAKKKETIPNATLGECVLIDNETKITFTLTEESDIYFGIQWIKGKQFENFSFNVQLEENSQSTQYEPYHEPKLIPINLNGNEVAKIGDVADVLKIYKNGSVEIHKKINKYVLNGSETITTNRTYDNYIQYVLPPFENCVSNIEPTNQKNSFVSNYFASENGTGLINNFSGSTSTGKIRVNVSKEVANNETEFKTWLNTNNVDIYYKLAETQIIKLPSIDPIRLFKGTNIFRLITNLDTTMKIEYLVKVDTGADIN